MTMAYRVHWIDNLRTMTIFMVVLYHVGGVYEAAGLWGWFWIVDDPSTITWVGIVGIIFDIMVMPIMFFIAGYLTPPAMWYKSEQEVLERKIKRLIIPWMIAVFTLIPIYKFIFLYSRGLPQEHWSSYFHITNQNSQNWLWFLPVLFSFHILYAFLSKTKIKLVNIPLKVAIPTGLTLGFISSFALGIWLGFRSWTLSPVIDFENERLLMYFMTYLLGAIIFEKKIFEQKPKGKLLYNVINGIAWIPVTLHIFARIYPFIYPEGFVITPLYRAIWWLSFYLSLICLMYIMIETFRRYFDKPGKLWNQLNKSSYGVYIIHVILIGVFGTILLKLNVPALIKYVSLIILVYGSSNLLVSIYYYFLSKTRSATSPGPR